MGNHQVTYPLTVQGLYLQARQLLRSGEYAVLAAQDGYLLLHKDPKAGWIGELPDAFFTFTQGQASAIPHPLSVRFGDALELVGYDDTYLVLGAKLGGRHLCLCVAANLTNRSGTNGQGASHDCQIGGDDTPTNPTPEPILSVIQAPSQAMFALGYADAAFDPDVPATSTAEPRLAFMTATRQRLGTRLG